MIQRGEIWWASLPDPAGSEPGFRRPVLIVQANSFNQSKISTVVGVVLTSNIRLAQAPGNVILPRRATGLPKESVANVSQIITIDKTFLTDKVGYLSPILFEQVENGLRLVLSL